MALDMNNATFARSSSGASSIAINTFEADIKKLKAALSDSNSKYQSLIKTIDENWVGADANDFKQDLKKRRDAIELKVSMLSGVFRCAINGEAKEFAKFQEKNVK